MKYTTVVMYRYSEPLEIEAESWTEAEKKAIAFASKRILDKLPLEWELDDIEEEAD